MHRSLWNAVPRCLVAFSFATLWGCGPAPHAEAFEAWKGALMKECSPASAFQEPAEREASLTAAEGTVDARVLQERLKRAPIGELEDGRLAFFFPSGVEGTLGQDDSGYRFELFQGTCKVLRGGKELYRTRLVDDLPVMAVFDPAKPTSVQYHFKPRKGAREELSVPWEPILDAFLAATTVDAVHPSLGAQLGVDAAVGEALFGSPATRRMPDLIRLPDIRNDRNRPVEASDENAFRLEGTLVNLGPVFTAPEDTVVKAEVFFHNAATGYLEKGYLAITAEMKITEKVEGPPGEWSGRVQLVSILSARTSLF